ncbi:MAG: hypothetical protein HY064_03680, partial [Bacteroidetes bacterium]|nr:hypothetical protein [Bacteroidota bacterium]
GQAGLDKKYNDLIAQADTKFKTSDWAGAKTIYQQASAVKGDVQYPKDQIAICDNNLAKEGVDKKYADLIKQADAKFGTSDWAGAKIIYQQAQAVKGSEKYPADQIAICDKNISQLGVDKQYSAAIAAADVLFTAKNWSGAKEKYQEASGIKPGEQYPKDRMKACDDELAKLSSLDQQYTAAVKRGDSAMAINDLETAQTAFTNAKNLKPAEKYPPQKLAEIAGLLSENSKDKAYRALIAKADSLLKLDSLIDAKKVYQSALVQKPSDEYPKKKIAEIDARLSDIKFQQAKDAKYNKLITQADTKFKSKDYKGAKSLYQQALQEKPLEIYPKTQINACDDALNPKVVKVPDSTKVVIGSDEYVSDLVKNYPPGVTETQMKEEGAEITKRVVIVGNKGWVYTKKVYSWGTFYFKDEQQITQAAYDYDTNATWVNKQNTDYQKNHK